MIEIGLKYTIELTVTDAVTAIAVGSGDMSIWLFAQLSLSLHP